MERTGGDAPPTPSDRDLVIAFKAGQNAAYDEMYERYHARVFGVCNRILRNRQDAEEAAQETFLRAYQALNRFNGRYQLGAWLARIATNASVDQLRSKSRAPLVGLPGDEEPANPDADPERVVVGEYPRLTAAIGDVKPLHAQALALRALEGLSHQEIADRLDLSPPQVKALLHRARTSLRRAWDRAEGWLLAPIFTARGIWSDKSGPATSPLLSAGTTLSPLLAERVATTALVVAVALSGLPSGVTGTTAGPMQPAPRPALHGTKVRPEVLQFAAAAPASEQPAEATDRATGSVALGRLFEDTLKGHTELDTKQEKTEEEDDPEVPHKVNGAARGVIKQLHNVLPQGGPSLTPVDG